MARVTTQIPLIIKRHFLFPITVEDRCFSKHCSEVEDEPAPYLKYAFSLWRILSGKGMRGLFYASSSHFQLF